MDARVTGKGVGLEHDRHNWEINKFLYPNDAVLKGESEEDLKRMVKLFK